MVLGTVTDFEWEAPIKNPTSKIKHFLIFSWNHKHLKSQVFGFFLGIGMEDDGSVLLVVFSVGIELNSDFGDLTRFNGSRKRHFCAGTCYVVIGNDQRSFACITDFEGVFELNAFLGFGEFMYRMGTKKFRRLTKAKGGI